jgi:hypothetical protein
VGNIITSKTPLKLKERVSHFVIVQCLMSPPRPFEPYHFQAGTIWRDVPFKEKFRYLLMMFTVSLQKLPVIASNSPRPFLIDKSLSYEDY